MSGEHVVQLTPAQAGSLLRWLEHPNGSFPMGRVTFEAVENGGLLVRTEPYRIPPPPEPLGEDVPALYCTAHRRRLTWMPAPGWWVHDDSLPTTGHPQDPRGCRSMWDAVSMITITRRSTLSSHLRAHVRALHPRMPNRRFNRDLAQEHARQHHRYHLGHYHEYDSEGLLAGPNTTRRQPSGWWTGLKVVMRGDLPWPSPSGRKT